MEYEDALQRLSEALAAYNNDDELGAMAQPAELEARKELRGWIRRGLIVEREGQVMPTDALQRAFDFVDSLDSRMMTSTASRLATVQREIEDLASRLAPSSHGRERYLKQRITALEAELASIRAGSYEALQGEAAIEGIREVYQLATSLRGDFHLVEDSYREADKRLRLSIVTEQHNRGEIIDELLNSHEALVETTEGRVFHGFYEQLTRSLELEEMKNRLRSIVESPSAETALSRQQRADLRWLVMRLVGESERVLQARARGEQDVKGFLRSGLAAEHHRVGHLLNEILDAAVQIDWESAQVRRQQSPLPPVPVDLRQVPMVERIRIKEVALGGGEPPDFSPQQIKVEELGEDFWQSLDVLDRQALFQSTLSALSDADEALDLRELWERTQPTHDLEAFSFWLQMARAAKIAWPTASFSFEIEDRAGKQVRYEVPALQFQYGLVLEIEEELLQ